MFETAAIDLLVKVSVPANVESVPVVGKVTFVAPVEVSVVAKDPAVVKSPAVTTFPPSVIVLPVFATPFPPFAPRTIPVTFAAVPVILPVTFPVKLAVIFPAEKSPAASLKTIVLILFKLVAVVAEFATLPKVDI
ncbi:MAG: hypothetical protein Q7U17_00500, partial [Sediminibacterium sp.]|nr:hypothetical protein [Sediminibacterium sp.]